jgi:hypothetical protein
MNSATSERTWTHEGRPELNLSSHEAGPGPWDDEPDKVQWIDTATGLDCLAVRQSLGAWCGYVGLPPEHPWHGKGYSTCLDPNCTEEWCYSHSPEGAVRVHGGLTFASSCRESDKGEAFGICHVPFEGRPHDVWWFGFDCAHSGDLTPCRGISFGGDTYRDLAYVKAQCASLAQQLAEVAA